MGLGKVHCVGGPIDVANDFCQLPERAFFLLKGLPTQSLNIVDFPLREMKGH